MKRILFDSDNLYVRVMILTSKSKTVPLLREKTLFTRTKSRM